MVCARWKNNKKMFNKMVRYDKLTKIIQQTSSTHNFIIGIVYFILPYFTSLSIMYCQAEQGNLIDLLCRISLVMVFIIAIVYAYLINKISASITARNTNLVRYLYKLFIIDQNNSLKHKLKIYSFIARLNEESIGYKCFNLFHFTKLTFFQYWMTVSSSYILITNVLRNSYSK